MHYDLVVIGGDLPGQEGSLAAARMNKRVAMIDCISEGSGAAWLRAGSAVAGAVRAAIRAGSEHLVPCEHPGVDPARGTRKADAIRRRIFRTVLRQRRWLQEQLDRHGVMTYCGEARFLGPHEIEVQHGGVHAVLQGERILVATGSRPARPGYIPFDGTHILDVNDLFTLDHVPTRAIVAGGGVTGIECATLLASLAVHVALIDDREELLDSFDRDTVAGLMDCARDRGVDFCLGEDVISAERVGEDGVSVSTHRGTRHRADIAVFAVGHHGNTESLNLCAAGLQADEHGCLWCNAQFQTWTPHIYAVGDVVGHPREVRTTVHQGRRAVHHAFGLPELEGHPIHSLGTIPELAAVGKTESQLAAQRMRYAIEMPMVDHSDSHDMTRAKLLYHPLTRQLLGAHAVGPNSMELILAARRIVDAVGTVDELLSVAAEAAVPRTSNSHRKPDSQIELPHRTPASQLATV